MTRTRKGKKVKDGVTAENEERARAQPDTSEREETEPDQKERSLLNLSVVIRGRNRGRGQIPSRASPSFANKHTER